MKDTEQALTFLALHLLCTAYGYCEWSMPRGKHNHIWLRHPLRSGTMICHQAELSHNCQYFLLVIEKAICVNFLYFIITMYHGGKTLLECLLSEFFSPRCAKGYYYLMSRAASRLLVAHRCRNSPQAQQNRKILSGRCMWTRLKLATLEFPNAIISEIFS